MTCEETRVRDKADLWDGWVVLLFGVRRSVRYHSRRRAFFDNLQAFTNSMSVIFGSAAFFTLLSRATNHNVIGVDLPMVASAAVAVFSGVNLITRSWVKARLHEDLGKRFLALERKMVEVGDERATNADLKRFVSERLSIEADEPPILQVLDLLCHNELIRAQGYGDEVDIAWLRRRCAQFISMSNTSPPKRTSPT